MPGMARASKKSRAQAPHLFKVSFARRCIDVDDVMQEHMPDGANTAHFQGPLAKDLFKRPAETEPPVEGRARAGSTYNQRLFMGQQSTYSAVIRKTKGKSLLENTIDESLKDGREPEPPDRKYKRQGVCPPDAPLIADHIRERRTGADHVQFRPLQHRSKAFNVQICDIDFMAGGAQALTKCGTYSGIEGIRPGVRENNKDFHLPIQ